MPGILAQGIIDGRLSHCLHGSKHFKFNDFFQGRVLFLAYYDKIILVKFLFRDTFF